MTNIAVAERAKWVGSSESAILFGVSPFSTLFTIWHQKKGNVPVDDLDHLERIQAGKHLEPAIAAWAAEKWPDWSPRNVKEYIEHPRVLGMGASLDFEDVSSIAGSTLGDDACPPIEIKNVDWLIFRDHWQFEGEEILDCPAHYLIQVQHQLACRPAAPYAWLLVCVGGNRLLRMRVARHPGVIARIEAEVEAFWESVRDNVEPAPDFENDGGTLTRLYAVGNGDIVDLSSNERVPALCAKYLEAKEAEKGWKSIKDASLAEIRSLVGSASAAACEGFTIKATNIPGGTVAASERQPYRRFTVKEIAQ